MKKRGTPNSTLNYLLLKIFTGANYVSKLAKETGKSIPVTFRQLEDLVEYNVLNKVRNGKRVEYKIKWNSLADILLNLIRRENIGDGNIKKVLRNALSLGQIQGVFQYVYKSIEEGKKSTREHIKMEIEETLSLFLEIFGMMNKLQQEKLIQMAPKNKKDSIKKFLNISKLHASFREKNDIRKKVLQKLET